jgi:hypothetical protein
MSQEAARTPGATRAGDGEYLFDLAKVNHILGGPDYSTANGACVEGDRMIGDKEIEAKPGSVVYVPSNAVHSGKATPDGDVVFFTCKDASHSLHGIKAA